MREPLSKQRRWYVAAAFLITVMACGSFAVDLPAARYVQHHQLPGDLRRVVMASEFFGHGLSVLLLIWGAGILDRRRWRVMGCLAVSAFLPGLLSTVLKGLIARQRPSSFLAAGNLPDTVWATFVAWFPAGKQLGTWGYELQSFPSSHTATAFGLAIGLSALYPHGRMVFLLFGLLAGLQRIVSHAHYPSDVLFGAALAFAVAGWWVTTTWFYLLLGAESSKHHEATPDWHSCLGQANTNPNQRDSVASPERAIVTDASSQQRPGST